MTNIQPPANNNYAAIIVKVPATVDLKGLDNLVGVPILGHQALTQRDGVSIGDLKVAVTAETQLSETYAAWNNLYRESELNKDNTESGYLEKNRRIRAIKLRGHRSDALLMPLESLAFTGINPATLREGDTFDAINGHEICRKYELPIKGNPNSPANKVAAAFKRVTTKQFPEHISTDNYWRNKHLLDDAREAVVTQKLHGTSIRVGRVPCLREKGRVEKFLNRWFPTADHVYDAVFGSRKVIKDVNNPRQNHHYGEDIWTAYGKGIQDIIPDGYIVYGELIGWTPDGGPIQKGYTYDQPKGMAELYVYRVAFVNAQGTLADLSWDGVKEFCTARGLKWAPELMRTDTLNLVHDVDALMDKRYADDPETFIETPVRLSDKKTVDEGVCIRQEGIVPTILKAKAPAFLLHETKLLDAEELDLESAA